MPAPLAGKCILDLGALCRQRPHALAVSMAAKLCVDYGARVVRVVPAGGDPLAAAAPLLPDGRSALDLFLNAGKERAAGAMPCDAVIGDAAALAAYAAPVQVRLSVFGAGEDPDVSELAAYPPAPACLPRCTRAPRTPSTFPCSMSRAG
jgi:hypothetical protein